MANEVQANGWTAVPISGKQIIEARRPISPPDPVKIEDVHFPLEDPIIVEAQSFVKRQLSPEAYNHSMRVYYWGTISSVLRNSSGAMIDSTHRTSHREAAVP
jgi:cyanamide hydratase